MKKNKFDSKIEFEFAEELNRRKIKHQNHSKNLPGTPDFVFNEKKLVVFVHGCFWHRHSNCSRAINPKNNWRNWLDIFFKQVKRDQINYLKLEKLGWWVFIAWECEIQKNVQNVVNDVQIYLAKR